MRRWFARRLIDYLTRPLPQYERRGWNDPAALKRHIRKGDVLLVEGDQRISAVIKLLTQSSWSHAALYVGDELVRRGGALAAGVRERFGSEAEHLLVEALPEGVVASPLLKYVDFNVRLCRPHRLSEDDLRVLLDEAVAAIGWRYDLRNVLDLARYLLPASLVPVRLRRAALHFGSGEPTEVICSSLIGRLFQRVRFPILPEVSYPGGTAPRASLRRRRWLERILGRESDRYTGIFRMRHPTLMTPRDFDLSPFFEIVKFNVIADGRFDYRRIRWACETEAGRTGGTELPEAAGASEGGTGGGRP